MFTFLESFSSLPVPLQAINFGYHSKFHSSYKSQFRNQKIYRRLTMKQFNHKIVTSTPTLNTFLKTPYYPWLSTDLKISNGYTKCQRRSLFLYFSRNSAAVVLQPTQYTATVNHITRLGTVNISINNEAPNMKRHESCNLFPRKRLLTLRGPPAGNTVFLPGLS